ncbi:hypothetical protein [Acinetobacter sp.]|jgi:hypothetical protein|uniref:hypothetical protein n=1 Tax=Acinetobacter sp. TaxID=472 RepID=UPI002819BB2F|nr:hypothetical protein [Acinetobacter sp.]MDR0237815.1 hypothetical protein [Acinetobacter sp.]
MIKSIFLGSLLMLPFVCAKADAVEVVTGKVKILETTYMPVKILLQLNVGSSSCPAGTWLSWSNPNVDNMKTTYATLLAAVSSGKSINIYINNSCEGQYLHIIS